MARILLVDDEPQIRRPIAMHLERTGHEVEACADGEAAIGHLSDGEFDLVITDIRMPKMTGLELLEKIRGSGNDVPLIVLTALSGVETAVEAVKLGADDYICKPPQLDEITLKIGKLLEKRSLAAENARLKSELDERFGFEGIIGESEPVRALIERLRPLSRDRDISVLILGESGTGKELAAKAVHYNSPRSSGPFVALNCAALPSDLIESELFGHEKGAFTGAASRKTGLFEAADGGTLFLDEISTMPADLQAKLLRAIEEREIRRVGGTDAVPVDIRIVSASNTDLGEMSAGGKFREDLYFRLAVAVVKMPPLRERAGDAALLAEHFLGRFNSLKERSVRFGPGAVEKLDSHAWPGNVRELENLVELLVVIASADEITAADVDRALASRPATSARPAIPDGDFKEAKARVVEQFEKDFLLSHLEANRWNISRTADQIGISRGALHAKMNELGLSESGEE